LLYYQVYKIRKGAVIMGREIMLRELKLANDLLGNCGIAKELIGKYTGRESLEPF